MFKILSRGFLPYYSKPIRTLPTKLIKPGLYVPLRLNDNWTTAKPARGEWFLAQSDLHCTNICKYTQIYKFKLPELLTCFFPLWHAPFVAVCRWDISYLLMPALLLVPVPGARLLWWLVVYDFKTANLVYSFKTTPFPGKAKDSEPWAKLELRRVTWGHVALF